MATNEQSTGHTVGLRHRLQEARRKLGLSQMEVGRRVGVTNRSISGYERMTIDPPVDVFARWARAVGMTLIVELTDEDTVPVSVPVEAIETARLLARLDESELKLVGQLARILPGISARDKFIIERDLEWMASTSKD